MSARAKGESIRVFPLSNWTELDVWQYILREGIEIVPLYFAAPRPTVERDGLILMVDDERFPLRAGETAGDALGPLPDARLLSADRRGRERGGDASRRSSQEMLLTTTSERQGRAIDRDAGDGQHGEEEAGGLFLMARPLDRRARPDRAATSRAYLAQQEAKELLRFITCGSVDDGKSTLIGRLLYDSKQIFDDQLARARGRQQARRHAGRGDRFRAAGRRPLRRARAGHHDRRRLPLLRDRQAQVHRRRHAGPRAIYAQHGDRRLDRRPRGAPGRRAQGRADPDPAAQPTSRTCSASATSCWR